VDSVIEWTVPGYTRLRPLGGGGFGTVVLARHDATGTPVAIKYLHPDLLGDPEFITMFRTEAEMLGELDDPHVVRLYEYVESPDGAAIVMELVDGVSVSEILAAQGKTTPEAALAVLFGSLLGLAAAHARGVVHRDYKPANVLVNRHGASKLTDFGIAARSGDRPVPAGSLHYAPPEQFSGSPASPAGDVYSAMATYYECLTGHPPFTGRTTGELLHQHLTAPVPLDPVPGPLRPLVASGLSKDPSDRPADAAALAARLRAVAIDAYGEDWERRGRSHLGEAALLLAALWPFATASAVQGTITELTRLAQPARHPARARYLKPLRASVAAAVAAAVVAAGVTVAVTSHASQPPAVYSRPGAAYQVPLITIPVTATSGQPSVTGDTFVVYDGNDASAGLSGRITGAASGDIVRLYAQPFPFTSAPVAAGSSTLTPADGTATYRFRVTPTVATRYHVEVLSSTTPAPLASSAITTIYVLKKKNASATITCAGQVCHVTYTGTAYVPPSALRTEMAKPIYAYFAVNHSASSTATPPYPATVRLGAGNPAAGKPQEIAPNEFRVTITFTYARGIGRSESAAGACSRDSEATDGIGLPGSHGCGAGSVPAGGYIG
jgi:serine/threonine-protein kinase